LLKSIVINLFVPLSKVPSRKQSREEEWIGKSNSNIVIFYITIDEELFGLFV